MNDTAMIEREQKEEKSEFLNSKEFKEHFDLAKELLVGRKSKIYFDKWGAYLDVLFIWDDLDGVRIILQGVRVRNKKNKSKESLINDMINPVLSDTLPLPSEVTEELYDHIISFKEFKNVQDEVNRLEDQVKKWTEKYEWFYWDDEVYDKVWTDIPHDATDSGVNLWDKF